MTDLSQLLYPAFGANFEVRADFKPVAKQSFQLRLDPNSNPMTEVQQEHPTVSL